SNDVAKQAYGIETIAVRKKQDSPPPQAADVIAYGAWKCATQQAIQPYLARAYGWLWKMDKSQRVWEYGLVCDALAATVDDLESRSHLYGGMFKTHGSPKR